VSEAQHGRRQAVRPDGHLVLQHAQPTSVWARRLTVDFCNPVRSASSPLPSNSDPCRNARSSRGCGCSQVIAAIRERPARVLEIDMEHCPKAAAS
jgi:hypothetical protein